MRQQQTLCQEQQTGRLSNLLAPDFELGQLPDAVACYVRLRSIREGRDLATGNEGRRQVIGYLCEFFDGRLLEDMKDDANLRNWVGRWYGLLVLRCGLLSQLQEWAESSAGDPRRNRDNRETVSRLIERRVVQTFVPTPANINCDPKEIEALVDRIVAVGEELSNPETYTPIGYTLDNWRKKGEHKFLVDVGREVRRLKAGLADRRTAHEGHHSVGAAESECEGESPEDYPLPCASVPTPVESADLRHPLTALASLVHKRQHRGGGWVAVLGEPGVGKSTLMAALAESMKDDPGFEGRIALVTPREVAHGLLADLVAFAVGDISRMDAFALAMRVAEQLGMPTTRQEWWGASGPVSDDGEGALGVMADAASARDTRETSVTRTGWQSAFAEFLRQRPALLVVNGVVDATMLDWLLPLPRNVVGVVSTWDPGVADRLGVSEEWRLAVTGLAIDQAVSLAERIAGKQTAANECAAMRECLDTASGHPLLVRVAASGAHRQGWVHWARAFDQARSQEGRTKERSGAQRILACLEPAWDSLVEPLQRRLTALGSLPLFRWYDYELGGAVWGVTAEEAQHTFDELVEAGLAERTDTGHYTIHRLVQHLAQTKRRVLHLSDWWRARTWIWVYSLGSAGVPWRWHAPTFPMPVGEAWLNGADKRRLLIWLCRLFCRSHWGTEWWEEPIGMDIPEWVLGKRRFVIWSVLVLPLATVVATGFVRLAAIFSGDWRSLLPQAWWLWPWLLLFFVLVAAVDWPGVDLYRMAIWRGQGKDSPAPFRQNP